jgi:hypothetical protein
MKFIEMNYTELESYLIDKYGLYPYHMEYDACTNTFKMLEPAKRRVIRKFNSVNKGKQ